MHKVILEAGTTVVADGFEYELAEDAFAFLTAEVGPGADCAEPNCPHHAVKEDVALDTAAGAGATDALDPATVLAVLAVAKELIAALRAFREARKGK